MLWDEGILSDAVGRLGDCGIERPVIFTVAHLTYTAPFNVAGFPAISIPLETTPNVVPTAMQIAARPGDDTSLLTFARQVETILRTGTNISGRSTVSGGSHHHDGAQP